MSDVNTHDQNHHALCCLLENAVGERPSRLTPLHGGCVAQVYKAEFEIHPAVAVKHEPSETPALDVEGFMLEHLSEHTALPLPRVLHAEPALLVLEYLNCDGVRSPQGETELADLIAELHATPADCVHKPATFGLERDTRIGPLTQPNTPSESWAEFFGRQRLTPFARLARARGSISQRTLDRIHRLTDTLDWVLAPIANAPPVLLHGDLWAGNILWDHGHPKALIDPACYRGHPEIELAFIDLMGGLSGVFWERYFDRNPKPRAGKGWETRKAIFHLYPLLVHATLFAGGYGNAVRATLDRVDRESSSSLE